MKKFLLIIIPAFLAVSAMGQSVNEKTQINTYQKQQDFKNNDGSLSKGQVQVLDSAITETYTGGVFAVSSRSKKAYTVNGSMITEITQTRSASTGFQWANTSKKETTVDTNGKTTLETDYTWNIISSSWVNSLQILFAYNLTGNLTSNSTYNWNTATSSWVGLSKTDYFYAGGNLDYDISYKWDITISGADKWAPDTKTVNTYASGKLILDKTYNYTNGTLDLAASEKTDYTYNVDGTMNTAISSVGTDPVWTNSSRTTYSYTNGKMTMTTNSTWTSGAWVNSSQIVYAYDANGRLILSTFSLWDSTNSIWIGFLKNELSYGVLNALSYTVSTNSGWDYINSTWALSTRVTSWYSNLTTDVNKISEKVIRVYPNPAKEFVVFDLTIDSESARVDIFDIQGKKVLEQQLSENKQLSVSGLRKGLYIYRLLNGGIIYTGKLLKE